MTDETPRTVSLKALSKLALEGPLVAHWPDAPEPLPLTFSQLDVDSMVQSYRDPFVDALRDLTIDDEKLQTAFMRADVQAEVGSHYVLDPSKGAMEISTEHQFDDNSVLVRLEMHVEFKMRPKTSEEYTADGTPWCISCNQPMVGHTYKNH